MVSTRRRAISVSTLTAVVVGTLMGAALVLSSEDTVWSGSIPILVLGALGIGAIASVLVSVPLGIVGGFVVAAILERRIQRSRGRWFFLGSAFGALAGASGSALYSSTFNGLEAQALAFFFVVGGAAGAICGAIIGLWCASQSRVLLGGA
jgi:hypothetical protein